MLASLINFPIRPWIFLLSCSFFTGCAVNIPQWDALRELRGSSATELEGAEWVVFWNDEASTFFAVATEAGALFADGQGSRIFFQELSISRVEGLVRGIDSLQLEYAADTLFYRDDEGGPVLSARCQSWQILVDEQSGSIIYQQSCVTENSAGAESERAQKSYTNQIGLDSNGEIARLEFVIHSEYAPLVMTHKKETR